MPDYELEANSTFIARKIATEHEATMDRTLIQNLHWENARVENIKIGSGYHDGRGFSTINFAGDGWGQGIQNFPVTREWVDAFCAVCGKSDLFSCIGALVRVGRHDKPTTFEPIVAVRAIMGDKIVKVG